MKRTAAPPVCPAPLQTGVPFRQRYDIRHLGYGVNGFRTYSRHCSPYVRVMGTLKKLSDFLKTPSIRSGSISYPAFFVDNRSITLHGTAIFEEIMKRREIENRFSQVAVLFVLVPRERIKRRAGAGKIPITPLSRHRKLCRRYGKAVFGHLGEIFFQPCIHGIGRRTVKDFRFYMMGEGTVIAVKIKESFCPRQMKFGRLFFF